MTPHIVLPELMLAPIQQHFMATMKRAVTSAPALLAYTHTPAETAACWVEGDAGRGFGVGQAVISLPTATPAACLFLLFQ